MHTFLLTGSVWLTAAALGAAPLLFWGMPLTNAFFESMSKITTTGSTVLTGLEDTPRGILAWRAILQWVGGVGFIVTGIALLPFLRVGGMQLFRTESSERGDSELVGAARFARATHWIYGEITRLLLQRLPRWRHFVLRRLCARADDRLDRGYSTYDASFGRFASPFLQWAGIVFMLAGAIPFAWYLRAVTRRRFGSEQARALLAGLSVVILLLTLWRLVISDVSPRLAVREVAFNVVSVVTTTGFATTDYTTCGPSPSPRSSC